MSAFLTLSILTASVSQAGFSEFIGQITGGIIGGVLCNELGIGKGSGRTAAVALCAVGGSMIGGEIGRDMDENDARAFEESQRRSFDGDLNRDYDWDGRRYGSRTGIRGRMRPIEQGYHRQTREVCREYQSVTYRGDRTSRTKSIVCQRFDGTFYSLDERSLFIRGQLIERERTRTEGPSQVGSDRRLPPPPNRIPHESSQERQYNREYDQDINPRRSNFCEAWDFDQVRRGDRVYTRSGYAVTYSGMNRSRRTVSVNNQGMNQIIRLEDIGITGCHYNIRTGRQVGTRYGEQGLILALYSNGDLLIRINGMNEIYTESEIHY